MLGALQGSLISGLLLSAALVGRLLGSPRAVKPARFLGFDLFFAVRIQKRPILFKRFRANMLHRKYRSAR